MNVKSRLCRWTMLAVSPVRRLSMPMTSYPRSRSVSDRCDPINPAAPVMTARFFIGFDWRVVTSDSRLIGVFMEEALQERQPHDLQIESHRPVFNVVKVVLDPLFERGVAAPSVDLRPPREPGLHLVAQHILRNLVLELRHEMRPLRPRADNRHVAAKDVPQLRQFVEIRPSQEPTDRRDARVVCHCPHRPGMPLGILVHRPELDDFEWLTV